MQYRASNTVNGSMVTQTVLLDVVFSIVCEVEINKGKE